MAQLLFARIQGRLTLVRTGGTDLPSSRRVRGDPEPLPKTDLSDANAYPSLAAGPPRTPPAARRSSCSAGQRAMRQYSARLKIDASGRVKWTWLTGTRAEPERR